MSYFFAIMESRDARMAVRAVRTGSTVDTRLRQRVTRGPWR
jgi:hypothetical protein